MIRTYKRKLILTRAQEKRINSWIGACRTVYNLALEIRIDAYKKRQLSIHKYDLGKQLVELRKDIHWIEDVPYGSLELAIHRLDKAYNYFFKGAGFPKFASKKTYNSIQFKTVSSVLKNKIKLPKIGVLRFFKDSEILGTPKIATIIKDTTGYFICIVCDNVPAKFISENQAIGLDMGIKYFCIDSDGCFIDNPRHFKRYEKQLRIENRSLARKKKGSNSWYKQVKKLGLLHHKISNVRKDFLHKESTRIAKANSLVFIEGLNITGMVKNDKLSKHILDCGWGMFKVMLSYKTTVVKVNPKFTSQTCFNCKYVNKDNRVSQSIFKCIKCGYENNADINAAQVIKSKGMALIPST